MKYLVPFLLMLGACVPDETIGAYAINGQNYHLTELNGKPAPFTATIRFEPKGKITGKAPCNRYFTVSEDPYPWLKIGPIGATKVACPDLKNEALYFETLESMTLAEASGPVLILSNDDGDEMVFRIPN